MKNYIVSFCGAVDISADTENEAEKKFSELTDAELGAAIEDYDEINESEVTECGNCSRPATHTTGKDMHRCDRCANL